MTARRMRGVDNRAWIFVSHSTRDIIKVRLIRNYLEREGANPLLFRLAYAEGRNQLLWHLLQREIEARQFFLLCRSKHTNVPMNWMSRGIAWAPRSWVEREVAHVIAQPKDTKHLSEIQLDPPKWLIPRSRIDAILQNAFVVFGFAASRRNRVKAVVNALKTFGVDQIDRAVLIDQVVADDDVEADDNDFLDAESEPMPGEDGRPLTIDHGIRELPLRAAEPIDQWFEAAATSATRSATMVLCASARGTACPWREEHSRQLAELRRRYRWCYVLSLDEDQDRGDLAPWKRSSEWRVFTGPIREQLHRLMTELRSQLPATD